MEIAEKVKEIISQRLDVDTDNIKDDASFIDDLGADSLDIVELVMSMEEEQRAQDQRRREYLHPDAETPSLPSIEDVDGVPVPATDTSRAGATGTPAQPFVRSTPKVGRNKSCPCGSGKKYKHCHGSL